ncbi:AP-1 complex-associated regulatory protein-like [Saccoglossus kowalevskii]|uniref:AP-1 complex-associated regulatory protein-like n=1 Tax=Saccoglossus kowalevskii TaxID=10224 RepID=A0ABM0MIQ2_SACKO|nr:PREDICTED: AP-1 complex-associated regulatory protein-like [Saccoglossus kowalevskii]
MGNCWDLCFGTTKSRTGSYLRNDYEGESLNIEFENLVEENDASDSQGSFILESERNHLMSRNYQKIVEDQRKLDEQIDEELNRQEGHLKVEEDAYIAAKKEAARVARQKRLEESKSKANGTGPKRWLGENESDWDVAGGEDDFEMFLESVKARSLNPPGNGMDSVANAMTEKKVTEAEVLDLAREAVGEINTGLDLDWEEDFVGAEISESDFVGSNDDPAMLDAEHTEIIAARKNSPPNNSGNSNEFVTEVQIETRDSDLKFDDDFPAPTKAVSNENLVESEADR